MCFFLFPDDSVLRTGEKKYKLILWRADDPDRQAAGQGPPCGVRSGREALKR